MTNKTELVIAELSIFLLSYSVTEWHFFYSDILEVVWLFKIWITNSINCKLYHYLFALNQMYAGVPLILGQWEGE